MGEPLGECVAHAASGDAAILAGQCEHVSAPLADALGVDTGLRA